MIKPLIRHLVGRLGYDIAKHSPSLVDFLESRKIDLVLDVGANIGQFGGWLRSRGYKGEIASFEPIRDAFEKLQETASRDRAWRVQNFALGDTSGHASINVSKHSVYSSLMPQTSAAERFDAAAAVKRVEKIEVVRLDDIFEEYAARNVFLKIDTQGFERQVLAGATHALETIKGVQLELPIVHLYKDTWTLAQALAFMDSRGFVLSQITPTNFLGNDPSLVEVDCVFRRRSRTLDEGHRHENG